MAEASCSVGCLQIDPLQGLHVVFNRILHVGCRKLLSLEPVEQYMHSLHQVLVRHWAPHTAAVTSEIFCPPKPKLFEIVVRHFFSRAALGT